MSKWMVVIKTLDSVGHIMTTFSLHTIYTWLRAAVLSSATTSHLSSNAEHKSPEWRLHVTWCAASLGEHCVRIQHGWRLEVTWCKRENSIFSLRTKEETIFNCEYIPVCYLCGISCRYHLRSPQINIWRSTKTAVYDLSILRPPASMYAYEPPRADRSKVTSETRTRKSRSRQGTH